MELIYFQTFREVADRLSFTRAAEELGYAQSSVTTQIQKLEKAYGVKLFERHGRQLRLTPPGEELLKIVVKMLDLYKKSVETVARQIGGTLLIGSIDSIASYFLPPYLGQLKSQYPELTIKLQTYRESLIVEKVKEGELDFGLLLDDKPVDMSLQCETIRREPLILISRPDNPLTRFEKVTLEQLREAEWIMAEESCNYRRMLEKALKAGDIPYRISFELGNPEAVKRCVMSGLGISMLPKMVAEEEVRGGKLVILPFSHPDISLDLQMLINPRKWTSQAMREFIEMLKSGV